MKSKYTVFATKNAEITIGGKEFSDTAMKFFAVFFHPIAQHTKRVTVVRLLTLRPATGTVLSGTSAFFPFAFLSADTAECF